VDSLNYPLAATTVAHALIVLAFGVRVIMKQSAPGVAFAWLLLIIMLPFAGAVLYLLIGERRIGPERARRMDSFAATMDALDEKVPWTMYTDVDWSRHPSVAADLDRLGRSVCGCTTVRGSEIELFSDTEEAMQAVARDIDDAETGVSMAFYIWNEGGRADEVLEAVIRAADRGVTCRILVDAIGGRPWLKGGQPRRLRTAGVQVQSALPVGPIRSFFGRAGLRLHRKVIVVDDKVAWTGSMNLADPRIFKHGAGVGEWVDAFARLRGSVVAPLGTTVLGDWMLETGTPLGELAESAGLCNVQPHGSADIQVVPSGPGETGDGMLQMLLALMNSAHEELVLTTPYLVPDDSMIRALRGAAGRGVDVSIIIESFVLRRSPGCWCRNFSLPERIVAYEVHRRRSPTLDVRLGEPRHAQPVDELRDRPVRLRPRVLGQAARPAANLSVRLPPSRCRRVGRTSLSSATPREHHSAGKPDPLTAPLPTRVCTCYLGRRQDCRQT
jgi:cardiolipin synthase